MARCRGSATGRYSSCSKGAIAPTEPETGFLFLTLGTNQRISQKPGFLQQGGDRTYGTRNRVSF
ncbi:MAG: hypothetical protein GDA38_07725 [Hormoscilla sp. SP12CHS1]|nr:hypothetical protein [Hormoscilla sp. SP12CHS1]